MSGVRLWWSGLREQLPARFRSNSGADDGGYSSTSGLIHDRDGPLLNGEQASNHRQAQQSGFGYTELMGGSVPCPSCKGSGRIPKELERELVALIPVSDDRLKPRRTWLFVSLGIGICVLIALTAMFFLFPRSVDVVSGHLPIEEVFIDEFLSTEKRMRFHFLNSINVTNNNYYSVRVVNASATIISRFQPWSTDVVGFGWNRTGLSVRPLTFDNGVLVFNNSVTLTGTVFEYCTATIWHITSLYVNLQFDITVTFEYFNHKEQNTITTLQQVCCVESGNCTLPSY
uniref:Transmembrane protein n=1 Tax=Plectus sambesii TaxID=2011161 RepID=A0A914UX31_9BILA